uniref:RNA-directed DNA polymerase n=1 Tax=Panagrolaimus superbus TaxID=310955 RepID=A0A914XU01_9BILA
MTLKSNSTETVPPVMVNVRMNDTMVQLQHDSGAVCTVIDKKNWEKIGKPPLHPCSINLRSYNSSIDKLGQCYVTVGINNKLEKAMLIVVKEGSSLLGRNWIRQFKVIADQKLHGQCNLVESEPELSKILEDFKDVFDKKLGTCDLTVSLKLKDGAKPKFLKSRNLPYSMRGPVEEKLEKAVSSGVLIPVQHSQWATPIVVVKKPNDIRICGDYKSTLNPMLDVNQYPLPKIEDMFHELNGGKWFIKLDLRDAYHQLVLDQQSKEYTTINTHKGLYRYQRLPFGIASAVAIFQHTMEKILNGIPGVVVYLDDVTITAENKDKLLYLLKLVLQRFRKHGLRLKREKCEFLKSKILFLGHEVDANGIRPSSQKLEGLTKMPAPKNVKEVEAFVGLVNYYGKFVKNLASLAAPLNDLRKQNVKWQWTEQHQKSFEEIKQRLLQADLLTHYDPLKELILATDASEYGIGAVLSHREKDGTEKVIAYASRKMIAAELNYAQIEKEALAIIFGVEKFDQYLLGRHFILQTDHMPLLRIFGNKTGIGSVAIKRLARWAIILMNYTYTIEYRKTEEFGNADSLSRLPNPTVSPSS